MSSSTTGNVNEGHRNFISIMAIEREKRSATSAMTKRTCGPRSGTGSHYKRNGRQNFISCRELHLCKGSGGDSAKELILEKKEAREPLNKTKGTQTDYRESSTQTIPWEVPYKLVLRGKENPEVLTLTKSKWEKGLPASLHEVQIIQRMRIKRAWLESLPQMDCPENIKTNQAILTTIEANEWAFREAEIQCIMDARMELMAEIDRKKNKEKEETTGQRIKEHAKRLTLLRDKEIGNIRVNFLREVRKLGMKHRASSSKMKKRRTDFIARFNSAKLDFCKNKILFGGGTDKDSYIWGKTRRDMSFDVPVPVGNIPMDEPNKWLPSDQPSFAAKRETNPEELCPRQTRWNDEKLKKLHADLKAIRLNVDESKDKNWSSLLKRKIKLPPIPVTPTTSANDNGDKHWENASLFLQKVTRGRAVQSMMFEGRSRCAELIKELESARVLEESQAHSRRSHKTRKSDDNVGDNDKNSQDDLFCEFLDSLEGMTVAEILDFLSKENVRLREERRAHGLALLAERERTRREAEEAGRRQSERNRRRELDEMFRQIAKVNQDSVEAYLEDIIKEGVEWVSDEQAREYVVELADNIDASMSDKGDQLDPEKDKELISVMIRNFLLPEVDKEAMRNKIKSQQENYIEEARRAIYKEMIELGEKVEISDEDPAKASSGSEAEHPD